MTLCTFRRDYLFGEVIDGTMMLNAWGEVVREEWERTEAVRRYIELDAFVVMPNHLHGIIVITQHEARNAQANRAVEPRRDVGATRRVAPTEPNRLLSNSLGAVIGQFKSVVTKRIRQLAAVDGDVMIWQRNYHDHIIRNEADLNRIRQYVATNPARWLEDSLYQRDM